MFNWRKKEKQPRAEKYGNIIRVPPPTSRPPHPPPPRQSKKDNSQQININVKIESKYGVLDSEILVYQKRCKTPCFSYGDIKRKCSCINL